MPGAAADLVIFNLGVTERTKDRNLSLLSLPLQFLESFSCVAANSRTMLRTVSEIAWAMHL